MSTYPARTEQSLAQHAGLLLMALALLVLLGACSTLRGTPARYQPTADVVSAIKLTPQDLADLQAATSEADRNQLQNKAVAVIDLQYHQFVRDLMADRSDASAAAAGTTLGASTAGAFVDSVAAKTNYALLAAGVVGAFGIIDKSYFYEKTVPALVAAMGAARANVLVRIRESQRDPIASYDGTAALADLEEYFAAGTVLAAIAEITARAESDKRAALDQVRALEVPTDAEIARRKAISAAIFAINDASLDKARKAATQLGLAEQKTAKDARSALLKALRPPTPERIAMVERALRDNGLLK